ncbi:MAG: GNAT family N-acetyltransferase [Saprospiraceae bacterium]
MIKIVKSDPSNQDFIELVKSLDADLAIRDGDDHAFYTQFNTMGYLKYCLVAYDDNTPLGCGALKEISADTVEIKRIYTTPQSRGKGIATMVMAELEKWAAELSYKNCILETGKNQPEAINMYHKLGYHRIPNYGQYSDVDTSLCFAKKNIVI